MKLIKVREDSVERYSEFDLHDRSEADDASAEASVLQRIEEAIRAIQQRAAQASGPEKRMMGVRVRRGRQPVMTIHVAKDRVEVWAFLGEKKELARNLGFMPSVWRGWYLLHIRDASKFEKVKTALGEILHSPSEPRPQEWSP